MSDENRATRGFALSNGGPTSVEVLEFPDGLIGIALVTGRPDMPALVTSVRLSPKTFALLHDAMAMAAHDPSAWRELLDEDAP